MTCSPFSNIVAVVQLPNDPLKQILIGNDLPPNYKYKQKCRFKFQHLSKILATALHTLGGVLKQFSTKVTIMIEHVAQSIEYVTTRSYKGLEKKKVF